MRLSRCLVLVGLAALAGCYTPPTVWRAPVRPSACADSAQARMRRDTTQAEARLWDAICTQHRASARRDTLVVGELGRASTPGTTALALIALGYVVALGMVIAMK